MIPYVIAHLPTLLLKAHFPDARELFPSESLPNGLVATQATFLALLSAKVITMGLLCDCYLIAT